MLFRSEHPVFRRRRWFLGRELHGEGVVDIGWFKIDGHEMDQGDWSEGFAKSVGVFLNGRAIPSLDAFGRQLQDETFYLLLNAHHEPLSFHLPERPDWGKEWSRVLDTADDETFRETGETFVAGHDVAVEARSIVLLRRVEAEDA